MICALHSAVDSQSCCSGLPLRSLLPVLTHVHHCINKTRQKGLSEEKPHFCFFVFFSHCWCSQQFLTSNSLWSNPVCDSITADRDRRVHLFSRVSVYTVEIMAIYSATIIQLWEIKCKSMRDRSTYIPLHFCLFLKRDWNFPPIGSRTTKRLS